MPLIRKSSAAIILGIATCGAVFAQAPAEQAAPASQPIAPTITATPTTNSLPPCRPAGQQYQPMDEKMPCAATAGDQPPTTAKKTYTVPEGTKVLLQLRSAINTHSAKAGDGVYLSSTFPVVVGNRVLIPAGVYVQGVVDRVQRAGRIKGKSELDMHFTSIIFPNGTVVEIPGLVNSLPGASKQSVKSGGEGTIQQSADKGRNVGKVAEVAIPTGGTIGSIGGLGTGHPVEGGLIGLGAGAAATGLAALFTRGADVNIESGSQVEMVLQRPLILEEENLGGVTSPGSAPSFVPAANQPRPMGKPVRPRILCPVGELGCS